MYNLIISGDTEAWAGKFHSVDISRAITEFTTEELKARFSKLNDEALAELMQYPCLFVYENHCGGPPRFGWFKSLKKRHDGIHMECEFVEVDPWLTEKMFDSIQSRLDIYGFEMWRTHWAVKDVDLQEEFAEVGITLPIFRSKAAPTVDPETNIFDVAFSFPGEARQIVQEVIEHLEEKVSRNKIFYDNFYQAFLARPNLDAYLSHIYRSQSNLIVVFLSKDYERKPWPGLEFRIIREIIFNKEHSKVMYVRLDDEPVDGVLKTDGYIDARQYTTTEIASFIRQRMIAKMK